MRILTVLTTAKILLSFNVPRNCGIAAFGIRNVVSKQRFNVDQSIHATKSMGVLDLLPEVDRQDFEDLYECVQEVLKVISIGVQKFEDSLGKKPSFLSEIQEEIALVTTLLIVRETREQAGPLWDKFRAESGTPHSFTKQDIDYLVEGLNLAGLSYTPDTDSLVANLTAANYTLVRHVVTNEPDRVGYFIAFDEKTKIALISIRGSSSANDFLTDACGSPVPYSLKDGSFSNDDLQEITCHEGILKATVDLLKNVKPLIEHLFIPSGYKIFITGHSLGAGVAALLGALLRSENKFLKENGKAALEVLAFAPPPVLNYVAAKATSDFVTSVVNNRDIVPRCSINNVATFLQFLDVVLAQLKSKGLAPTNPINTYILLNKLLNNKGGTIMTAEELFTAQTEVCEKGSELDNTDNLFVPGKVFYVYTTHNTVSSTSPVGNNNAEQIPKYLQSAIETDGSSPVLQFIEVNDRIIADHMVDAYNATLTGTWSK